MNIRHVRESDYVPVISVINDWWGGRQMADMLPKLFFQHFQDTSLVMEKEGELLGFLIGLVSQTDPNQAYIHFVGVHPAYRKDGIAKQLYELFFEKVKRKGCRTVRCVTSPVNKVSIAFHTRMGFQVEMGDGEVDGVPVTTNYDGKGHDRVLFLKHLEPLS
ncbi:GNAT family N-acetyltransferase [Brevibacillus ruminantium]|uniref:GNAT family N-acetyltransferase n=1 Tax=Brevibacillus ruminantium TaxID=2950604 RepID=A0ABY4WMJ7_9BACL|nr:GNAT family N-acetyltransferase [Brevibacillus ruminantium]USG68317.1 GNAT family N-acetyltransferase [Brevibacillus ruminantium]